MHYKMMFYLLTYLHISCNSDQLQTDCMILVAYVHMYLTQSYIITTIGNSLSLSMFIVWLALQNVSSYFEDTVWRLLAILFQGPDSQTMSYDLS